MSEAVNKLLSTALSASGQITAVPSDAEKRARYETLRFYLDGLIADDQASAFALMSNVIAVLHNGFDTFFWTGFYRRVAPDLLEVGPNQGSLGCTSIRLGQGVCGTVAASGITKIVADVNDEPNHIGCDDNSKSEIVVPLVVDGDVIAVLDIDSAVKGAFNQIDQDFLEPLMQRLADALAQKPLSAAVMGKSSEFRS